MAIYRLLREATFSPEDINRMTAAYEAALRLLRLQIVPIPLPKLLPKRLLKSPEMASAIRRTFALALLKNWAFRSVTR
jgi:hypothetical protein